MTKFVPRAAYVQTEDGLQYTLEQAELMEKLMGQETDNPDQVDLDDAIRLTGEAQEMVIEIDD